MHWWQPTNSSMNHRTLESLMDRLSIFMLMQTSTGCHKKGWWLQSWSPWSPNSEISNICCRLSPMKSEIYMDIVYKCVTYMPWKIYPARCTLNPLNIRPVDKQCNLSCQMYIEPTRYLAEHELSSNPMPPNSNPPTPAILSFSVHLEPNNIQVNLNVHRTQCTQNRMPLPQQYYHFRYTSGTQYIQPDLNIH